MSLFRLTDLDASFIALTDGQSTYHRVDTLDAAQGVMFQCPRCAVGKERGEEEGKRFVRGAHYVICWLRNPRTLPPVPDSLSPGPGRWWVEGTSLEDLTFAHGEPSMPRSVQLNGGCNWHGLLTNGELTDA